jgi:regulator of sirC expression with transglutaminase-like and TPR domain
LLPKVWAEYRDRGLAHAAVGEAELALSDLETYLQHADSAVDVQAIALRAAELRGAIN